MDGDNSGKLSVKEIREKLGQSISQEQYNSLLRQFDKNSDGEISRYEFRDMMKALVRKQKSQSTVMRKASLTKPMMSTNNKLNTDPKLLKRTSVSKPIKR